MDKDKIIYTVLVHLGLLPGDRGDQAIQFAAQKALNDADFVLAPYKGVALCSILGTLKGSKTIKYLIPQSTSLQSGFFELTDSPTDTSAQVTALKTALEKSSKEDEKLLWVLECHACTLAVSEKHNTVSLFDFVKLTAALAFCFESSDQVRMVSANISGIQTYLYEIVSKNASKLLKGRSFYLQLLEKTILDQFLKAFEVKSYCTIYASGGGFYILVPKTDTDKKKFDTITSEIATSIYKIHKANLFVETAMSEPFDGCEKLSEAWDDVIDKLKKRRTNRLGWNEALRKDFFGFVEEGGETKRDPITSEEIPYGQEEEHHGVLMQKITKQQIELGKKLREANYWAYKSNAQNGGTITDPFDNRHYFDPKQPSVALDKILTINSFVEAAGPTFLYGGNGIPIFENTPRDVELMKAENEKIEKTNAKIAKDNQSKGKKDIVPLEVKYEIGDVKPFDVLAQGDGLDRLGILRMDVDDLGSMFRDGFGNLCQYAAVSRSLDIFFKGYLNTLWQDFENTTQIIYSGGDDLFVVGKWNDVFKFAREIRAEFNEWSCGVLTLSGGMVLVPAKFPVMQGARLAADAEKVAKKHRFGQNEKNAISFLDMPLNWDEELPVVIELFSDLFKWVVKEKVLSKGFLDKIAIYAEARQSFLANTQKFHNGEIKNRPNPAWVWTMLYDLSRYKDQQVKTVDGKKFVLNMLKSIMSNTYKNVKYTEQRHFLDLLSLAARWVELEMRTENTDYIN